MVNGTDSNLSPHMSTLSEKIPFHMAFFLNQPIQMFFYQTSDDSDDWWIDTRNLRKEFQIWQPSFEEMTDLFEVALVHNKCFSQQPNLSGGSGKYM